MRKPEYEILTINKNQNDITQTSAHQKHSTDLENIGLCQKTFFTHIFVAFVTIAKIVLSGKSCNRSCIALLFRIGFAWSRSMKYTSDKQGIYR